jgi:hypothetical protein
LQCIAHFVTCISANTNDLVSMFYFLTPESTFVLWAILFMQYKCPPIQSIDMGERDKERERERRGMDGIVYRLLTEMWLLASMDMVRE